MSALLLSPTHQASALDLAKARATRRASQDGGVIFVVALTLSVLAAVGAWALQSAALEVRTAGYERQATQTHYLSEYGTFAVLTAITPSNASVFLNPGNTPDPCISVPPIAASSGSPLGKMCMRIETVSGTNELMTLLNSTYPNSPPSLPTSQEPLTPFDPTQPLLPGSLGYGTANAWEVGDFWVELSEPQQIVQQTGFSSGGSNQSRHTYRVTVTAAGITQLQLKSGGATNPAATWGSEGVELQRVRMTVGPF